MLRTLPRPERARAIGLLVAALLAASLVAGCNNSSSDSEFVGMTEVNLPQSHTAALPAWGERLDGEFRRIRPKSGSLMAVYFGYTFCPDVCPTTLSGFGAAVRTLPQKDQQQIEAAMVTVDPARDKGPELVKYVQHFFPKSSAFAFRTTDEALLKRTLRAFGAAGEIDPHKRGENYTVTHTASLYVVDRDGRVVLIWPYGTLSDDIAADLKVLLARNGAGSHTTQ